MLYALVDGKLKGAEHGLAGVCPDCDMVMLPKCGELLAHHWAHKTLEGTDCREWEKMSSWHKAWQDAMQPHIPGETVEVPVVNGQKYKRADIRTKSGLIIEIQSSNMSPGERRDREQHYDNMVWIIKPRLAESIIWSNPGKLVFIDDMALQGGFLTYIDKDGFICEIRKFRFISDILHSDTFCIEDLDKMGNRRILHPKEKQITKSEVMDISVARPVPMSSFPVHDYEPPGKCPYTSVPSSLSEHPRSGVERTGVIVPEYKNWMYRVKNPDKLTWRERCVGLNWEDECRLAEDERAYWCKNPDVFRGEV